ncbi:MAG TPA: hypothetical protein VGK17_10125 [Propionicimonas sp.]
MAGSLASLLRVLAAQSQELPETPALGSWSDARVAWCNLARATARLLTLLPGTESTLAEQRLSPILNSLSHTRPTKPALGVYAHLERVGTTIGVVADVLSAPAATIRATEQAARSHILGHVLPALSACSAWTLRTLPSPTADAAGFAGQLKRIRTYSRTTRTADDGELTLSHWRWPAGDGQGISEAFSRWESAAVGELSGRHTLTQLALQLAAADIALICIVNAAALEAAMDSGHCPPAQALRVASEDWRHAAIWPQHLKLGGRTPALRQASQDLRASMTPAPQPARHTGPGAGTISDDALATLLWGLQAAQHVGVAHQQAVEQLTHGEGRVWIAGDHVPQGTRPAALTLATSRLAWLPDEQTLHSARPLLDASTRALRSLQDAREVAHRTIGSPQGASPPTRPGTHLWEVVVPPDHVLPGPEPEPWPALDQHLRSRRQIGP